MSSRVNRRGVFEAISDKTRGVLPLVLFPALALWAGAALAQSAGVKPFSWQNPLDFAYPCHDGVNERSITELRDPAIIREGDRYYLVYTVYPFTHSDSRDAKRPDNNSSPGIMLYSSLDLMTWKFENWLVKSSELPEDCPYKHRFLAPEIHKIGGKCYLIFIADNWLKDAHNKGGKIGAYVAFVGVADKINGPYRHITWLKGRAATARSSAMTAARPTSSCRTAMHSCRKWI